MKRRATKVCFVLNAMLLVSAAAFAQSKTVTGKVVDDFGEPITGANVVIKGTTVGAITDLDGNFSLTNVPEKATLHISFIGYADQDVSTSGKSKFNITLSEDSQTLDDVVVVGYGVQRKSDVTGAMSRLTSKNLEERPVQNAVQAMQGKIAGMDVTSNNRPGELGQIRIRGNRSLLADNSPLYVIDGIPMTAGSMADINPSDIESMEVLKDASATAIYGSRGANGVILITTKKGKVGKTSISYDGSYSWSRLIATTDYMNSGQLLDYKRQAAITGGTYNGKYGDNPDPDKDMSLFLGTEDWCFAAIKQAYQYDSNGNVVLDSNGNPIYDGCKMSTTDWGDLATQTGFTHNHQLSISAGSEKSKLYISFGYLNQEMPMRDQDYNRYTANLNGDITPVKWMNVGLGLNGSFSIKNYGIVENTSNTVAKDSYGLAMNLLPWMPAKNEDGSWFYGTQGTGSPTVTAYNIPGDQTHAENEYRYYALNLSSYAEIDFGKLWSPLNGLKWRTNFGTQFRQSRLGSFYDEEWSNVYGFDSTAAKVAYNNQSTRLSWTLENLIYYNKDINDKNRISVTLMQSAEQYRTEGINVRAYDVVYPTSKWYDVGNSNKDKTSYGSSFSTWARESFMARINYSLMNRYLLTLTGRYDGASVLAEGNKWDFFPSAALAWRMEEEEFIKQIDWIQQLKLRAGYGVTGNAAISPYTTSGSVTSTYAKIPFGYGNTSNTNGAKPDVMPNSDLGWERTASLNFGVDFSILRGRIGGSIEWYQAKTTDLLMRQSIPVITGYAQILTNLGETQNQGFEITLNTVNVKTKNFTWTSDWSFATNEEKIVKLINKEDDIEGSSWFIGKPLNVFFDYEYDRIWQDNEEDALMLAAYKANSLNFLPGQYKIKDQEFIYSQDASSLENPKKFSYNGQDYYYEDNGFGKFDNKDKITYQKSPKCSIGWTNTFTYKNWSVSAFLYGRFGNYYYGLTQTIGRRVENDTWSPTNTGAKFAQPTTATRTTTYDYVRNYAKGNMVTIRNISLNYALSQKALRSWGADHCSVYAQVINPFLRGGELVKAGINPDDITGWDASNHIGGQTNNTAITRSFVLGVRVGF